MNFTQSSPSRSLAQTSSGTCFSRTNHFSKESTEKISHTAFAWIVCIICTRKILLRNFSMDDVLCFVARSSIEFAPGLKLVGYTFLGIFTAHRPFSHSLSGSTGIIAHPSAVNTWTAKNGALFGVSLLAIFFLPQNRVTMPSDTGYFGDVNKKFRVVLRTFCYWKENVDFLTVLHYLWWLLVPI